MNLHQHPVMRSFKFSKQTKQRSVMSVFYWESMFLLPSLKLCFLLGRLQHSALHKYESGWAHRPLLRVPIEKLFVMFCWLHRFWYCSLMLCFFVCSPLMSLIFFPLIFCFVCLPVSTAELNVDLARPLKINPTLTKLEQAKAFLQKVLPTCPGDTSSRPPSASSSPQSSPKKTPHRVIPPRPDPHHEASARGKGSSVRMLALSFHKVSLHTAQVVVVMETEAHPMRPSITLSVSAMTGSLSMKSGPKMEGKKSTRICFFFFQNAKM